MKKVLRSVHVENIKKVADQIGIKLEEDFDEDINHFERDLLKYENPKFLADKRRKEPVKKFIEKYEKYFTTTDKNLLREFYEKTGLILMNVFEIRNPNNDFPSPEKSYYATMYGFLKKDSEAYGGYYNCVYNNHLTSHIEIDSSFLKPNEDEYYEHDYDKEEAWGFTNEENAALNKDPELIWTDKYEHCFKVGPRKKFVGAFGELFEIKDGDLYRNGNKIEENVETVFRFNDCTSIVIFKDHNIEYLEWHLDERPSCQKYDKILYGTYFIAFLKDGNLGVRLINEEEENISHEIFFDHVKDIEFVVDPFELKDITGNLRIYPNENNEDAYINFTISWYQAHVWDYCE